MIKFLLITIVVMWLLRFVVRMLLPMIFQKVVSKAQSHAQQQYRQQQGPQNFNSRRPTGDLHIDYIPPKDKEAKAADKAGDFIDFEEVK